MTRASDDLTSDAWKSATTSTASRRPTQSNAGTTTNGFETGQSSSGVSKQPRHASDWGCDSTAWVWPRARRAVRRRSRLTSGVWQSRASTRKGACVVREAIVGAAVGGPYSPAVVAEGRFVFVAGPRPLRNGHYVPGSIEEETEQTLRNIGVLLEKAGSGFEHAVRCGVWLVDLDDFAGMNGVYQTYFPEPRPARATVRADLVVGK